MSDFLRDLRFGARMLARSPVFAVTAALLLAICISANTLIFSVIDAWILRPLPVSHPENLVRLIEVHPNDFSTWDLPYNLCESTLPSSASLSEMICQGEADVPFSDRTSTERIRVHLVSPNFFSSLEVRAHLGRVLTEEDEACRRKECRPQLRFLEQALRARFRDSRPQYPLARAIVHGGGCFVRRLQRPRGG